MTFLHLCSLQDSKLGTHLTCRATEATEPVTHDQRDTRPTVTFPAAEHFTALWPELTSRPAKGRRLSWPEWLLTYQDSILTYGHPSQY